jgi:hypothetical protein
MKAEVMAADNMWYTGPEFLLQNEESLPSTSTEQESIKLGEQDPEVKVEKT